MSYIINMQLHIKDGGRYYSFFELKMGVLDEEIWRTTALWNFRYNYIKFFNADNYIKSFNAVIISFYELLDLMLWKK